VSSRKRELNQPEVIRFRAILPLDGQPASLAEALFSNISRIMQ
jgi:hypothetical protein